MTYSTTDPIEAWLDSCKVLVFYGLDSEDGPVGPRSATLALPLLENPHELFLADVAPHLSVQPVAGFQDELDRAKEKAGGQPGHEQALRDIQQWVDGLTDPVVGYQLEPSALAGTGRATEQINGMLEAEAAAAGQADQGQVSVSTSGLASPKGPSKGWRFRAQQLFDLVLYFGMLAVILWLLKLGFVDYFHLHESIH
jgi:hypothetical protein